MGLKCVHCVVSFSFRKDNENAAFENTDAGISDASVRKKSSSSRRKLKVKVKRKKRSSSARKGKKPDIAEVRYNILSNRRSALAIEVAEQNAAQASIDKVPHSKN